MLNRIIFLLAVSAFLSAPLHAAEPSTAALIEQGHYLRVQAILTERLKSNPNDPRSYCEMSKVSEAFQRWDDAIQQAEKAVSLDHKSPEFQAALADAVGSKLSAAHLGFFAQASLARRFKKEADLALQLDPNNVDANEDLMEFHLDAPGLVGGDKKKAADLADHMMRINPVHGYLMKLELATHEKHTAELEQLAQQAITADPRNYEARIQAATFYLDKGTTTLPQAEEQARQAVKLDPGRIRAYNTLATIYAQQSRWKDLDSLLADAQHNVPDDFGPLYQAARVIFVNHQTQELPRAEKYMRSYLSQPAEGNEPSLAAAHWRLGLILEKEGHKDQAKQELQQAVNLDPTMGPAQRDLQRLQ
jgi:tetratricopeptide (TPR) repeat protein